jgi:hypothetical protein
MFLDYTIKRKEIKSKEKRPSSKVPFGYPENT